MAKRYQRRNLAKARRAKSRKRMTRKSAAAKRTSTYKMLKKKGITADIGTKGMTIEKTIPMDVEITRNIGHPAKKKIKWRRPQKEIDIIGRRYHYSGDKGIGRRLGTIPMKEWKVKTKVDILDKKVAASGNVSSSWINYLEWNPNNKTVTMGLLDGWNYVYRMKFKEFMGWYYAVSKGTYWWVKLKKKYYNKYINKYKLIL